MNTLIKPIRPEEVQDKQDVNIPSEAIEAFNELIVKEFRSGSCNIYQKDVVALMVAKGLKREQIFNNRWLDVENIFSQSGWSVEYDKPGFNESYEPVFKFRRKK